MYVFDILQQKSVWHFSLLFYVFLKWGMETNHKYATDVSANHKNVWNFGGIISSSIIRVCPVQMTSIKCVIWLWKKPKVGLREQ